MHKALKITRLIQENLWQILAFAFGKPVVRKIIDDKFSGEWKYLNKTIEQLAEVN
jgi:hypothetical protein